MNIVKCKRNFIYFLNIRIECNFYFKQISNIKIVLYITFLAGFIIVFKNNFKIEFYDFLE